MVSDGGAVVAAANDRKCVYVVTTFQYIRGLSFETDLSAFYEKQVATIGRLNNSPCKIYAF